MKFDKNLLRNCDINIEVINEVRLLNIDVGLKCSSNVFNVEEMN